MENEDEIECVCHSVNAEQLAGNNGLLRVQFQHLHEQAQTLFNFGRLYQVSNPNMWCIAYSLDILTQPSLTYAEAITYNRNHVRVKKDSDAVGRNFPDVDVTLLSPAFQFPGSIPAGFHDGTAAPTRNEDMDQYIRSLAARNEWMSYRTLDFLSEEDRTIPVLHLSSSPQGNDVSVSRSSKLRIWIQAAVHGNEPAGDQAVLALLGKMDSNHNWTASLLNNMDIFILPRYNPDGVAAFQRKFPSGFDGNRDHIKFALRQTRDIKKVFNAFSPHVAVDMHEYSATFPYLGRYRQSSDALFSAAKNLNIHANIRRLSECLFGPSIARNLESKGLRWAPYVTGTTQKSTTVLTEAGSDAKTGRNAMGLTQCIALLTEARGIGVADQHFSRRTAASLIMLESILQTATNHATEIQRTIQGAILDFCSGKSHIIVTDSPIPQLRTFPMVDCQTGMIERLPVRFLSTTPTLPGITRSRPEAYIIHQAWEDLASRLRDSGLEVVTLPDAYRGKVEVYNVISAEFEDTYHEGIVPLRVKTEIVSQQIELDAGAYWISTRQKNAALAFIAIEPENVDSWVSLNIVAAGIGDQLPFFRVMQ